MVFLEGDAEMKSYEDKEGVSRKDLNIVQRTSLCDYKQSTLLTKVMATQATSKSSSDENFLTANKSLLPPPTCTTQHSKTKVRRFGVNIGSV